VRKVESEFRIFCTRVNAAFGEIPGKVLDGEERVAIFIFSCGTGKKSFDIFGMWIALIRA
jgi:hypothetical protein